MTFTIDTSEPAVIALQGDVLGGAEAMEFSTALNQLTLAGSRAVVIDLSGVELMNSSGLGMLVGALKSLRTLEGRLAICGANELILNLLKMTRLDTILNHYPDSLQARTALGTTHNH